MEDLRALPVWLASPTPSRRYRLHARLYAAAIVIHLALPEVLRVEWLVPNALAFLGAALLATTGATAGWALAAAGTWAPLFFLGDVLTQSAYLALVGTLGAACGVGRGRARRIEQMFPLTVRVATVGLYAIAALHKLNRGFFDRSVSCANAGVEVLAENWSLGWLGATAASDAWPVAFLLAEVALAALFIVRPAAAFPFGALMHVPLTVVFAPSFAFTMISGWVVFAEERDVEHLFETLRRRRAQIAAGALGLGLLTFALYLRDHWVLYPFWHLKEALLYGIFVWTALAWRDRAGAPVFRAFGAWREPAGPGGAIAAGAVGLVLVLNALSPYLGHRFHHAGAMLSNLRVDRGCWNSLFVPELVRARDPYVRIDDAATSDPRREARALESHLEVHLFDVRRLDDVLDRWCRTASAPLRARGSGPDGAFDVADVCPPATRPWPRPMLPNARPFQEGLERACPQRCMH